MCTGEEISSAYIYVHWQQEHISITDLLRLLPCLTSLPYLWKCVWLAEACALRQTSHWLAAKTYRVQHIFYFNHFSQGNLISSKWIVNEGDSIVLHLFYLKVLLYAPCSQKWLKLVPKRIIKADQIFLCVKTALISYFCHWRRPF